MKRYFLELAYDGTAYHGWQVQNNAHSVQAEINTALQTLLNDKELNVTGCGRTDAGVHASQFYLHFDAEMEIEDADNFVYRLNQILPKDIVIYRCVRVHAEAHARFDATSRTYQYHIIQRKNPFNQKFAALFTQDLDVTKMHNVAQQLFGHKDFTSFSKLHSDAHTNNCKIFHASWKQMEDEIVFEIKADRFLRNMVRAIVGTCIEVGKGRMEKEAFVQVIEAKDRQEAGHSVPAKGLFLMRIEYDYL
ncbi:MAG: tRNA pseudouridine(38-40) synthase TruA [Flavobacteriales bacterium]|nr:tRNA pseudouridine(38-40) synthase TruA [Flavobacteriales bacterium]